MFEQFLSTAVEPEDQRDLWEVTLAPGLQAELPLTKPRQTRTYLAYKDYGMEKNTHIFPQSFPSMDCPNEMHTWKLSLKVWVFSWGIISKRKSIWIKEWEFYSSSVPSSLALIIAEGDKRN